MLEPLVSGVGFHHLNSTKEKRVSSRASQLTLLGMKGTKNTFPKDTEVL